MLLSPDVDTSIGLLLPKYGIILDYNEKNVVWGGVPDCHSFCSFQCMGTQTSKVLTLLISYSARSAYIPVATTLYTVSVWPTSEACSFNVSTCHSLIV